MKYIHESRKNIKCCRNCIFGESFSQYVFLCRFEYNRPPLLKKNTYYWRIFEGCSDYKNKYEDEIQKG